MIFLYLTFINPFIHSNETTAFSSLILLFFIVSKNTKHSHERINHTLWFPPSNSTPMNCNHATFLLVSLPPPPPPLLFPKFHYPVPKKTLLTLNLKRNPILRIKASKDDNGQSPNWSKWIPTGSFAADKVFRLISSATASPIGQFVSSPTTFLHSIDPRVKLVSKFVSWVLYFTLNLM